MIQSIKVMVVAGLCFSLCNCSLNPVKPTSQQTAQLDVRLRIATSSTTTLASLAKNLATTYDSLIIETSAMDMDTKRVAFSLKNMVESTGDTSLDIPAGNNRHVIAYTKSRSGTRIHGAPEQILDCNPGQSAVVRFYLKPVRGSIYINLNEIPTTVDTVCASFVSLDAPLSWQVGVKKARETRVALSLDTIPDNLRGKLLIAGITAANDTLYQYNKIITFSSTDDSSLSATFSQTPGALAVSAIVETPGVTLIAGSMGGSIDTGRENGKIIISEIMYAVNDSEYVELYNPADTAVMFDTLVLNKDGTDRLFTAITINAHDFFVIGRKSLPWAEVFHSTQTALDLSSTSGNTLTVKDKRGVILDRVTFIAGSNSQEWPVVSTAKKSIMLDSLTSDPTYNNYGKHWVVSQTLIDTMVSGQYGTPGGR